MPETKAQNAARAMSEFVNIMGCDLEDFINEMASQHRTLQQSFTGVCVAWLEDLAKRENYDLRNEQSVKLGKLFVENIDSVDRHLPLI